MADLDRWRQIARKWRLDGPSIFSWSQDSVCKAIAEAVAEERERCAKICDARAGTVYVPVGHGEECANKLIDVLKQCAAAIRADSPPKEPPK